MPGEVISDPWLVYIGYWKNALSHGVRFFLNKEVDNLAFNSEDKIWQVEDIKAKHVINCGGLWGDEVEKLGSRGCHTGSE